jgi:hypothetical protein
VRHQKKLGMTPRSSPLPYDRCFTQEDPGIAEDWLLTRHCLEGSQVVRVAPGLCAALSASSSCPPAAAPPHSCFLLFSSVSSINRLLAGYRWLMSQGLSQANQCCRSFLENTVLPSEGEKLPVQGCLPARPNVSARLLQKKTSHFPSIPVMATANRRPSTNLLRRTSRPLPRPPTPSNRNQRPPPNAAVTPACSGLCSSRSRVRSNRNK